MYKNNLHATNLRNSKRTRFRQQICFTLLFLATTQLLPSPAQYSFPGSATPKRPPKSREQQLSDNSLYITRSLQSPLSMPNIPEYTGVSPKFVSGLICPNLKNGRRCISQRYLTKETPDIVLQWYIQALKQCQWSIDDSNRNPGAIVAICRKNKSYCQVSVANSCQAGYKTYLEVRYTESGAAPQDYNRLTEL